MLKVLLVDDEQEILANRAKTITGLGYCCEVADSGNEAIQRMKADLPDIILTDIKMTNGDGFSVLQAAREIDPDLPVIVFTGYGSVESAVAAIKMGAFDYIQKPISKEAIEIILHKASEYRRLKEENFTLKKQFKQKFELDDMVYASPAMTEVARRVLKAAKSDANVLITGETGTGKEMIARNIHTKSNRRGKPFIPIDCVALPANLMESELFGFEKGAFTGAHKSKFGLLELANSGTLFLDEITELDVSLQAKLLRVLQEKQFRRVGGTKLINVDVRILSATNRPPEAAVKENFLRQDLYFRLNVVPIVMPPLRDRKDDIPILVQHFIREFNPSVDHEIKGVAREAMHCLQRYDWPGNVRELKNAIEQAVSMAEQAQITVEDLPEKIRQNDLSTMIDASFDNLNFQQAKEKYLNQFHQKYFSYLMKRYDGNISKVAQESNLSRWTVYRIIQKFRLEA